MLSDSERRCIGAEIRALADEIESTAADLRQRVTSLAAEADALPPQAQ